VPPTEILVPFERQTASRQAVRRDQAGALRRRAGQALPALPIKLSDGAAHLFSRCRLTILQDLEEPGSQRIIWGRQLLEPGFQHMKISQGTQCTEQPAREFLHCPPGSMAIHLRHDRGDRTTTANCDSEVVDGVGTCRCPDALEFLEDTTHLRTQSLSRRASSTN
jgi:hypothetical protein